MSRLSNGSMSRLSSSSASRLSMNAGCGSGDAGGGGGGGSSGGGSIGRLFRSSMMSRSFRSSRGSKSDAPASPRASRGDAPASPRASRGDPPASPRASAVTNDGNAFDDLRCLSVLTRSRSVDLIASTNRQRDDWRWALEMLHVHWTSGDALQSVAAQRKAMGVDVTFCATHSYLAADVLGEEYVALELSVTRSESGMGIVMDAANNTIVELEPGGTGASAGLQKNDLIAVVDGNAVTVIENGYIVPRSTVTAAIDPKEPVVQLTLFRRFVRQERELIKSSSAQRL
jgi:hypothetical protein